MNQYLIKDLLFDKSVNMWKTVLDTGAVFYNRFQPFYQKGDVIKRIK
jgi:hypothetical protein